MAKVQFPLLSRDASGRIGKQMVFRKGGIVTRWHQPTGAPTAAQLNHREAFKAYYMSALTQAQADLLYSSILHLHDDRYSLLSHDHASLYAALNHNHSSLYAALSHNHSGVYSPINHTHNAGQSATLYVTVNQTILTSGSWQDVAWDGEVADVNGWHDPVINNARIYLPIGEYIVVVQALSFAANSTGTRAVKVVDSAGNGWGSFTVTALSGESTYVPLVVQRVVAADGVYLTVQVKQTSGGSLALQAFSKVAVTRLS
jgi:hypothetical protein